VLPFTTQVREVERRETIWAVTTVFLVLLAHAILETARDALFLSHLPTSHLPWIYIALAVLALLVSRFLGRSGGARADLRGLVVAQLIAAGGTAGFVVIAAAKPAWAIYALYLWGGLASTLILMRFWLLLSGRYTASQAKRLFPTVAAGPLLGPLVGYGVAGLLSTEFPPAELLAASAFAFLLSAGASLGLARAHGSGEEATSATAAGAPRRDVRRPAQEMGLRESVARAVRHPYVRRVASLLLVSSVTVTLIDFIFKTVVAREVDARHLSSFLATAYFSFDLIALLLLFSVVLLFVRSRGVAEALAVQPLLLLCGGILLTVSGGLPSVLCLRGVDGALRWSLHKTATELLYVPLSQRLRSAIKAMSDIVAHRGGQAIGSLLILAWLALAADEKMMGPVVIGCAGLWVYLALSLRRPYLDLFRETVSQTSIETRLDFPELDMESLETLIAALSSRDDAEVLAAMYLLQRSERVRVIPALILYHPSPAVVVRALEMFAAAGREDFLPLSDHLTRHPDAGVRAAITRATAVLRPDLEQLRRASESESPSVAVTAIVVRAARDDLGAEEAQRRLEPFLVADVDAAPEVRFFIARALRDHPAPGLAPLQVRLAAAPELETRREAVRAMGAGRDERQLPVLVSLLSVRELRQPVREALLAFGPPAFAALRRALADQSLPRAVRIHLPRTISRFCDQHAADGLLHHLSAEPSGTVRFKILRGLGRLVADQPEIELASAQVGEVVDRQLEGCLQVLRWRIVLERGAEEKPERRTPGFELLADLLRQKELFALERLFRALHLRHRGEELDRIYDGLRSADPATRSSSRELLHHLLPAGLRASVVGLVEELPDVERLEAAGQGNVQGDLGYEALLATLVADHSVAVHCVASYHAAELGLSGLRGAMESQAVDEREGLAALRRRSLDLLSVPAESAGERLAHGT